MQLLIAYHSYPEPDTNAGGHRLSAIIKILREAGHSVTLLAQRANAPRYREDLENIGVTCAVFNPFEIADNVLTFRKFLEAGKFDAAILSHYFVYLDYANYLRIFLPDCPLALDLVDIHHLRELRAAELSGDPLAFASANRMREKELSTIRDSDQVWAITHTESNVVRTLEPAARVCVVPLIHDLCPDPPMFCVRNGIIFLGGYGHSPNVDAVHYFMKDIYPRVEQIRSGLPIMLAGNKPPQEFSDYLSGSSQVMVPGFVPDHRAVLQSRRVGIAPLRFGAGMKGKIAEYLACGLPCVTTSIGAEGMDLENGETALIADEPQEFTEAVVRLHEDEMLWKRVSTAGREHIARLVSPDAVAPIVLKALASLRATKPRSSRSTLDKKIRSLTSPLWWCGRLSDAFHALRVGGAAELQNRIYVWMRKC